MRKLILAIALFTALLDGRPRCSTCARDSHGRIKRNPEVVRQFKQQTGYPHGRPGWIVDHKIALCAGGKDEVSNLAWQSKAEAAAKDKIERTQCR